MKWLVVDRLDLCASDDADPARTRQPDLALALALTMLMSAYPQSLRILVCSAGIARPGSLQIFFSEGDPERDTMSTRDPRKRTTPAWH